MNTSRYGNLLTIILIILIVAILAGSLMLVYNYVIKPNRERNQTMKAIDEFDKSLEEDNISGSGNGSNNSEEEHLEITSMETNPDEQKSGTKEKKYYNGFIMLGYITIPKTNVKEPILESVSPDALNNGVAVLYPSNGELNKPGNAVIIGHNYRNGKFFSNNKKLEIGDKVKIKDKSGTELTYTIYEKFQTSENDTSFFNRDTKGAIEVTLSTCTDDSKERTIILARVEE